MFGLDLVGAVKRQGAFVRKMCQSDWLHSPLAFDTMTRLITKYGRFMALIIASDASKLWVPTLDVDLAWHTHQLAPPSYYIYTTSRCIINLRISRNSVSRNGSGQFIDHDDKVEENKLGEAFVMTTKEYQGRFGEVYSKCACWYCEAVRASTSTIGSLFGISKQEKVADKLYQDATSLACNLPLDDGSRHISTHNSVSVSPPRYISNNTMRKVWVRKHIKDVHRAHIIAGVTKAHQMAAKRGRKIPEAGRDVKNEKNDMGDYWCYKHPYAYPWVFPMNYPYGYYGGKLPGIVDASPAINGEINSGGCAGAAGGCGNGVEVDVELVINKSVNWKQKLCLYSMNSSRNNTICMLRRKI